jgi:hypothetical protein
MQNQYTGFETGLTGLGTALKATQDAYKPVPLGAGDSLVTPGGTVVIKGVTYNVQPDPLNPGHFISTPATSITPVGAGGGAAGGSTGGGSSNPAANALDAYNGGADPQYSSKVLGIQKTINAISPTPTADSLNTYIATYGKAPINGTMIMQVAQQYGLDPSLMAAQLALESHFGMIGESPNNNNPGGLKWANQPGAVQGEAVTDGTGGHYAKFKSPLDGLYAMGALMQQKNQQVASAGTSTGSGTSTSTTGPIADPQGNVFSPAYAARAQKVIAAAPILAPYITAGPGGVAYIAGDKATAGAPGLGNVAHLPAVQATGMPVDTDGGLGQQLDGLNTIAQQQQTMKTLIETSLNTGGGNSIWSHAINSVRADFNSLAQNDQAMTALTAYTSSVLAAAAEIKNLVGGAGSGVRITGFEITNQQAQMPQASDSYQQALTKLDAMNLRLAQALHTVFPDYDVSKAPLPQSQTPGQFTYGSSGSSDTTAAPGLSATSAAILAKYGIQ